MTDLDAILNHPRYAPRHGWHDDHRAVDGTPAYLPAMQQVRAELMELLELCKARGLWGSCLQLGMGECEASHAVWQARFAHVVTIDKGVIAVDDERFTGRETSAQEAIAAARANGPYDLVFIDAGHSLVDVQCDHITYGSMRTPGGLTAFHDAVARPAYPEVGVPAYLATLRDVRLIGTEVGIAWV